MTDSEVIIHRPFERLHAVMYVLTLVAGAALAGMFGWATLSDVVPDRRAELMAGLAVVAAFVIVGLSIYWLAYLGHQRTARVSSSEVVFRPWISFGGLGRERVIPLDDVRYVMLLRPHHIDFTTGDPDPEWASQAVPKGVERVGTFWWRHDDYVALRQALEGLGIPTDYRHIPGIGTLLASH